MTKNTLLMLALIAFIAVQAWPKLAHAGDVEVSLGFSFSRSNYSETDYTWNRRYGLSAGYYFNDRSGIELAFQDIVNRAMISGYENTTFHDKVYSANWNQALVSRKFPVQPYVKLGFGQLNRDATGEYAGGSAPPIKQDSLTVVIGGGVRIYLTQRFAVRADATSYLAGGSIATWDDNFGITIGTSIYF